MLLPMPSVTHLPGEIFELKAELNNEKKEKRKEAVKKVIAAMTVGKDVRYSRKFKLGDKPDSSITYKPTVVCPVNQNKAQTNRSVETVFTTYLNLPHKTQLSC